MVRPLILTLHIDQIAQSFYEDLRCGYFPPERNLIPAHLSLFHQLPDEGRTHHTLREVAQAFSVFPLTNPSLRPIGRGVAVFFKSEHLGTIHAALSSIFQDDLIPQDRQRFQPHIVVQNKVDLATARHTLAELQSTALVEPHSIGFTIWRYLGGPWERLDEFPFADQVSL